MIRQKQIEQPLSFGLLSQFMDDGWRPPPVVLQLGFVDALCRYAFGLYPVVDLLDLLNGNRSELRLHPWRDPGKGWVAIHLDGACHAVESWLLVGKVCYGGE